MQRARRPREVASAGMGTSCFVALRGEVTRGGSTCRAYGGLVALKSPERVFLSSTICRCADDLLIPTAVGRLLHQVLA